MKSKFIKIISLILALIMLIPTNLVYAATQGNGTGSSDNSDIGNNTHEQGREYASYSKTGWLVYLVDTSGNIVDDKVVYVNAGSNFPTGYNKDYLSPRFNSNITAVTSYMEDGVRKVYTNAPWGTPFAEDGTGRGAAIRNEIINNTVKYDSNATNMEYIIMHYLRNDIYNKVRANPNKYYLILEACAYHSAFNSSGQNKGKVLASAYGWALLNKAFELPKKGDGKNGWCDQYRLQRSCRLQKKWPGLPNKPTDIGSSTWASSNNSISYDKILGNYGYGMIAIRSPLNTTCNEDAEGPHTAPDESDGVYTITKLYRIKTIKTKSDGTQEIKYRYTKKTQRQNVAQKIRIEDETCTDPDRGENDGHEYYKVIAYRATDKLKSPSNISDWDHIPGNKSGSIRADRGVYSQNHNVENLPTPTNYHEVLLNSTYKHLYILLEKAETEEVQTQTNTGTYTLNELDITQKIKLSDTAKLLNADGTNKLLTHAFTWESPKFTLTACRGDSDRTDHKHYINHGTQTGTITLIPDCDNYTVSDGTTTNAKFKVTS